GASRGPRRPSGGAADAVSDRRPEDGAPGEAPRGRQGGDGRMGPPKGRQQPPTGPDALSAPPRSLPVRCASRAPSIGRPSGPEIPGCRPQGIAPDPPSGTAVSPALF